MTKLFYSIRSFAQKLLFLLRNNIEETGAQYVMFGIFGVINYPLSFFMWHSVIPQEYNPLGLRIIAALLCIPLILKNYWPSKFDLFLPLYWYVTLLFCLPFFGAFMLLKNQFSFSWLMNDVLGLFLFVLLVDWISFIILVTLGIALGWLCYWLTGQGINYPIDQEALSLALYMYPFAIVIGAIFSRNKEKITQEKLQTIKTIGASIAHELRTPLRTINSAAHGMKKHFPILLDAYKLAKKEKLPVQYISPLRYETLLTACEDIELETEASFTVINMLLMNVSAVDNFKDFKICSILDCVDRALHRYPFNIGEANLVHWQYENDFQFKGNELLIIHVIFNLLKNSVYYIKAAQKGEIKIWAERSSKYHQLHFKDTGKGIPAKILPYIFERFFSRTYHGTGIGLAFCKMVMENLGGKIIVQSIEDEYTEFVLYFPIH